MSRFETLVKKTLEMQRTSAYALPVIAPNKAISSMINKLYEIGIPDNLNTLALRMIRMLQRVARMQVIFSPPTLPAIPFPEPAYQEAEFEEAYPRIEDSQKYVVTSRFDPVTSIIRRMVRSFLRRPRRPERGSQPEPPSMKMEVVYTIPEYKQRIIAAIPPLAYVPPEMRPRPEIERPEIVAKIRLEEISASNMVDVPERYYEIVEEYEVPGKGTPLMPRTEPPRAITPSLRIPPSMRKVSRMYQDLAKWAVGMSAAQPVITKMGLVDNYVDMQASIHDIVSQQVEVRKIRPTYDWRPLILEATKIASEQVFAWDRVEKEVSRPGPFMGPQIERVVEAAESLAEDELPPLVTEILTREAESKAALVSSEVERVTRQLAEEAAETYRQALTQLMPVHRWAAVKELVHAPGLKELVTKKLRTSLEIIDIREALSEEVRERGVELGKKPPLHEYITMASRLAGITRPELPSPEEEIMEPTPPPLHRARTYIDIAAELAEVSKLEEPIISIEGEMEEVAKAPQHPIKAYVDLTSRLGEFLSTRVAAVYGVTAALMPDVEYLDGELDVPKTFDYLGLMNKIVTSKVEAEKVWTTSLSGMVSSLLEVPMGEQAPERAALEFPVSVLSPRLVDMVPMLSHVEAIPRAQRPPSVQRERVVDRRRPIDIKVEQKISDIDSRELERKIARILREEARRYGVY